MAQQIVWKVDNFGVGMHTEPGRVGAGAERFAREVSGLRIDADGHLRPRAAFKQFGEVPGGTQGNVTGVASAQDYLLSLRADGTLWIRFANRPDVERQVQFQTPLSGQGSASPMRGMLSVIGDFQDFALVKGQGGSPFWIDMREDAETYLYAYRLGLAPPDSWNAGALYPSDRDVAERIVPQNSMVFWRWTYVRAFGRSDAEIRDNVLYKVGELFNGMESNSSPVYGLTRSVLTRHVVDNEGHTITPVLLPGGRDIQQLSGFQHIDDPQVTGIMLYQSEPIEVERRRVGQAGTPGRINVDALRYRRIAYLPKGVTAFDFPETMELLNWADKRELAFDNDTMPETERMFLYNDRIFCPTDAGLRFSKLDGTILKHWAYPKTNEISRSGVKDLVAHRGVLLFGGPTDLHNLAGSGRDDYVVNRLGTVGPVSAHAMNVFQDSVAFVGAAGFYGTDGVSVQKLSQALDADFEDYETTAGHCHMLPDDSLVFIVQQTGAVPRRQVYHFDGGWFQWPRVAVRQVARWESGGVHVMLADESETLRQLLWNQTDSEHDDDAADSDDLIDWHWESERLNFGDERVKRFSELQIEGQARSVVPEAEARWGLTIGNATLRKAFAWRIGNEVFGIGDQLWGTSSVASRVRLTIWVDAHRPMVQVFEMRRDDVRPMRIPIRRRGRAVRFKIEGRGHLHLRALTLLGGR